MKKALIAYLVILIGVFVLFSALDSGGDYALEKKIWKLQRQFNEIAKDPGAVPDLKYDDVLGKFQAVIDQHPDSKLVPSLYVSLGRLHMMKKDYVAAREQFQLVIRKYPENRELSADALFSAGKTYEVDDNWSKAYETYQSVLKNYPETDIGLSTPLYVAHYYQGKGEEQNAILAYDLAENYYKRVASEHSEKLLGLNALRYLSNCYLEQDRWNEAINTLGSILEAYASSGHLTVKNTDMMIKTVNVVSAYQLKDYDVAIRLYQGILDRNPEHPLRDYLKKVIEAFNLLKEKGVQVSEQK